MCENDKNRMIRYVRRYDGVCLFDASGAMIEIKYETVKPSNDVRSLKASLPIMQIICTFDEIYMKTSKTFPAVIC